MSCKLAIIYGDEFLRYDFGAGHPLNQVRLKLAVRLMEAVGLIRPPEVCVLSPASAALEDVLQFHNPGYIEFVTQSCSSGGYLDATKDTPAFPAALDGALAITGGTLQAVDMVLEGGAEHAFNLGGGMHHAFPDRAAGFCIINDIAVAIRQLQRRGHSRIMYIDIDAHQGDGVMYSFYDDGSVLDVDFHEDGRHLFPGRGHLPELGRGDGLHHKINVPFPLHSSDSSFRYAFRELVPALARRYQPEIILMQCGVDMHLNDPLSNLRLSANSYVTAITMVHELAHELCDGKLVLFGGGGYDPASTAVGWTHMVAALADHPLPERAPESWRETFNNLTGQLAPLLLSEASPDDHTFHETWSNVVWLKRRLGLT